MLRNMIFCVLYPGSRVAFGMAPNTYCALFTRVFTRLCLGIYPGRTGQSLPKGMEMYTRV